MAESSEKTPSKGYGKHSKGYWVLVYVVAAIIIYGLIYLIFFNTSGSTGGGY
ncbi:MAG TPA: hypothetical protein VHB51_03410 [Candidatus Saccharimonadales bacterium]|nr:hypothetical protein [Candidatus Saccharimonadales bacterium]